MAFERVGGKVVYEGRIGKVRIDEFRHDDGEIVTREVIDHPGASVMLPLDGDRIWLVRQPREVVGEQALLELPAGKLNGHDPLDTAKRELREEIGKSAGDWRLLKRFYTSPGFATEEVHLFLATELYEAERDPDPGERIEIVEYPLTELDRAIADCADAKSLVGLLMLKELL